jgi:hypothetical protein
VAGFALLVSPLFRQEIHAKRSLRIRAKQFYAYLAKSLQEFPNLTPEDFPKFEDFDTDGDGYASFQEWQDYVYGQNGAARPKSVLDELDELEDEVAPRMYEISPNGAGTKVVFDSMESRQ